MATILDKDLTRESKVRFDNREIVITLTDTQTINLKLKGMKSGEVSIDIETLYKQLVNTGEGVEDKGPLVVKRTKEKNDDDIMVSLSDIRGAFNIKKVDVATTVLFDTFFSDYIKVQKELRKK
jgi:hypothetical protein